MYEKANSDKRMIMKPLAALAFMGVASISTLTVHAQTAPSCAVEKVQVVASGLRMPYSMSIDDDRLVVSTMTGVVQISNDGTVAPLFATQQGSPSGVLKDGASWLFVENATQSLIRYNEQTGTQDLVASNLGDPVTLARQGRTLWITDYALGSGVGRLLRVDNGALTELRTNPPVSGPSGVTVSRGQLYYAEFDLGQLRHVDRQGKSTVITSGLGQPVDIKPYRSGILVADFGGFQGNRGRLLYVTKSGQIKHFAGPDLLNSAVGLAVRGSEVLIADMLGGRILKAEMPSNGACYR